MVNVKQNPASERAYINAVHAEARRAGYAIKSVSVNLSEKYAIATDARGYKFKVALRPKTVAPFRRWVAVNPASAAVLNRCKKMLDDQRTAGTRPTITYHWKNPSEHKKEMERVADEIISLRKKIAEAKQTEQFRGRAMGMIYRPLERKVAELEKYLGTLTRLKNPENGKVLRTYVVPDRELMTKFLGKIIRDYKRGDQVEIWYKDKRYTWEKLTDKSWRKVAQNPQNETESEKDARRLFTKWLNLVKKSPESRTAIGAASSLIGYLPPRARATAKRQLEAAKNIKNPAPSRKANFSKADFRHLTKEKLQELSKMFQGHADGSRVKTIAPDVMPDNTFRLGYLKKLIYKSANGKRVSINFSGDSMLSADIRCNLWISGKDARISNLAGGLPVKPHVKGLGDLVQVEYVTAKRHIESGRTVRFWHPMGEVTKQFPKLAVDYDGFPILIGGGYDIWNVGIVD